MAPPRNHRVLQQYPACMPRYWMGRQASRAILYRGTDSGKCFLHAESRCRRDAICILCADAFRAPQRRKRALHAIQPFADLAAGADGGDAAGVVQVQALRVDQAVGQVQVAAEADGKGLARLAVAHRAAAHLPGHPEVATAVGHARHLGEHAAGLVEGFVHDPQRARAADVGEVEIRGRMAL